MLVGLRSRGIPIRNRRKVVGPRSKFLKFLQAIPNVLVKILPKLKLNMLRDFQPSLNRNVIG